MRINLIRPKALADQHLVAEYNEMLMLLGYVKRYPSIEGIPEEYTLGPGHIKFFKNKLKYIKTRHELLKKEMRRRGFATNKTVLLSDFNVNLCNDWVPKPADFLVIKERLTEKIRMKPEYYRYYREYRPASFFLDLIKKE